MSQLPSISHTLTPRPRKLELARSYVEGLEADRRRLFELNGLLAATTWEAIQLGTYNRALYRVLVQFVEGVETGRITEDMLERASLLLAESRDVYNTVWTCPCGHSKYDHDERGCVFLACRRICSPSDLVSMTELES